MKEEIKSHWHTWVFYLTLGILFIIVYKLFDSIGFLAVGLKNLLKIVTPFLAGLLMAYLLYIPENKVEKSLKKVKAKIVRKNARKFGILITYFIAILIFIIIINFILPVLIDSINELIGNLQNYYSNVIYMYNKLPNDSVLKTEQVYNALKELQKFDLKQYVSIDRITSYIKGAVGIARGIFDVFVAIVVSIYILSERDEIVIFLKKLSKALFKEKTNIYLEKYFYRGNGVFFKFISGQFLDAIVIGVFVCII